MISSYCDEVVEVIGGDPTVGVVLSAEHASNALPTGWTWPSQDLWLRETHWAFDLGVEQIVRGLAQRLCAPAVMAGYSRLLVDPNRPATSDTLFRDRADGKSVQLNMGLTPEEQQRRIACYHEPFHQHLDAVMGASPGAAIVSMHSFTPVYEHQPARPMEIGVLFDQCDAHAHQIAVHLRNRGWRVALNEPYSGKDGLMYSADRHAQTHQRVAIEFEIRQDVATDGSRTEGLIEDLSDVIRAVLRPGIRQRYESS